MAFYCNTRCGDHLLVASNIDRQTVNIIEFKLYFVSLWLVEAIQTIQLLISYWQCYVGIWSMLNPEQFILSEKFRHREKAFIRPPLDYWSRSQRQHFENSRDDHRK